MGGLYGGEVGDGLYGGTVGLDGWNAGGTVAGSFGGGKLGVGKDTGGLGYLYPFLGGRYSFSPGAMSAKLEAIKQHSNGDT